MSPCNSPSAALETWKWCSDFCRAWTSTRTTHNSVHGWMKVHHASFIFLLDTEIQLQQTPRKQVGMGSPAPSLRKAAFRPCWILSSSDNPHLIPAISLHHEFKGQRVSPPRQNATTKLLSPTLQLRTSERGRCWEKMWKMTQ